jgi:hypothetical protein
VQRRRPNPRVRRAAQQEPDRHDDGPLSGRGESTGRYARIYAGRPPSPAGDGPATDAAGRDRRRRPCVMGGARRVVDRQRSTARPPADAADRGPDALAEVPIADPSLLLSVVAPRPTDAATVDGAAATIPGSTRHPGRAGSMGRALSALRPRIVHFGLGAFLLDLGGAGPS